MTSVEGEANPRASSFGDANQEGFDTVYRLRVGDIAFPVQSQAQLDAFERARRCRAYYVKSTLPVLLSAESLDP